MMPDFMDAVQERVDAVNRKAVSHNLPVLSTAPANEFCEDCGMDIPATRRLAMPGARYCVDCQLDQEKYD